jgi:hypothetical protein
MASEVARLRAQIEAEYQAAQRGLTGLAAGTTRHAFITAKMERMTQYLQQLTEQGRHEEVRAILLNDDLWMEARGEARG